MPLLRALAATAAVGAAVAAGAATAGAATANAESKKPNIFMIVADDLGYDDLGHNSVMGNGGTTISPNINNLIDTGVMLNQYYTFKVCSPTRSSLLTGRYPWGAGFYDMADDGNHCTDQFALLPSKLRDLGYATHALGKWDVGDVVKKCTPTFSGFDTFTGYYEACLSDYWYHWASRQCDDETMYNDMSTGTRPEDIGPADAALNGTYDADIFTSEAVRIITEAAAKGEEAKPIFMYLAYQNVHLACGDAPKQASVKSGKDMGLQAPCETVDLYEHLVNDTAKVQGAMVTELDYGVGNVTAALKSSGLYNNSIIFLVSDNGAQLDHGFNAPLRGGKHGFWEGGVRVVSFLHSPLLPASTAGTTFNGMAHSSDWYVTLVEGVAGGNASASGPRDPDGLNLWPALQSGGPSPRLQVVHQVNSSYFNAFTGATTFNGTELSKGNCDGSCGVAIRVGDMKLIDGIPGADYVAAFPAPDRHDKHPFGRTGGHHEEGTGHCRAQDGHVHGNDDHGVYLFNLTEDLSEEHNLAGDPQYADLIAELRAALAKAGATGPPPAYAFLTKAARDAAMEAVCTASQEVSCLEPGDWAPTTTAAAVR